MAADAEPLEILLHLPLLCEDKVIINFFILVNSILFFSILQTSSVFMYYFSLLQNVPYVFVRSKQGNTTWKQSNNFLETFVIKLSFLLCWYTCGDEIKIGLKIKHSMYI